MTDEVKNNIIIAEFMGYSKEYIESPPTDTFKYHSLWEWLIPVVEKIESIKDSHHGHFGVHISSNNCTIQATNFRPDKPMANPPHYFSDFTLNTKIDSTYRAVVEFIKWYNNMIIK